MKLLALLVLICLAYVTSGLALPNPAADMVVGAEEPGDRSGIRDKRHLLLHAKLLGLGLGAAKLGVLSHIYRPRYYLTPLAPPYGSGYEHYERYDSNGFYG